MQSVLSNHTPDKISNDTPLDEIIRHEDSDEKTKN